ncbi:endonuclease V [Pontibacter sp. G13]|uniref:endonuclease V n=1 Tax=Pontibacter sp. G13 TaxID=3074898 RepID=UPI002889454F|nr:endonuclease V [Pontibacter sp. G13]WNJ20961.1 endonuclease V [Pontibacter sp. G13]
MNQVPTAWKSQLVELAQQVDIPVGATQTVASGALLATFDIQYESDSAFVAVDLIRLPDQSVDQFVGKFAVTAPYVPRYFSFREGPPILGMLKWLRESQGLIPDLILIDGHGIAHPLKMGVATYVGILANVPAVGCAKDPLLQQPFELDEAQGSICPMWLEHEQVGIAFRSRAGVKPIFLSPGHRISLESTAELAHILNGPFRILPPIRRADQLARQAARREVSCDFISSENA